MKNNKNVRKFGQNFLVNRSIVKKITKIGLETQGKILEIGPGEGFLTGELIKKYSKISAIEVDPKLIIYLSKKFSNQIDLINKNCLRIDWPKDTELIFGNLAYNITGDVIMKSFNLPNLKECYFLIQKEVANKIVTKHSSSFKLKVCNRFEVKKICEVKKIFFRPIPKVDGAVIHLIKKKEANPDLFFEKFITEFFNYSRKRVESIVKILGAPVMNFKDIEEVRYKRPSEISLEELKLIYQSFQFRNKYQK